MTVAIRACQVVALKSPYPIVVTEIRLYQSASPNPMLGFCWPSNHQKASELATKVTTMSMETAIAERPGLTRTVRNNVRQMRRTIKNKNRP